jgi:protein disulfide-isomerase
LPALIAAFLLAAGCSSSGTSAPPAARGSGGRTITPPHTTVPVSLPPSPTRTVPAKPTGAQADITTAIHRAKASGRRVLIDFGAGWCVDCRVLDTIMERPAVAPTVKKNFVIVHVNVHNFNFNMDISRMYGNACKGGIPALVVLDGRGKMLVNTHDGSFEHARVFGNSDVLKFLNRWAPKA